MKQMHNILKCRLEQSFKDLDAIPEEWRNFIEAVNNTYLQFDKNQNKLERSLDLTSQELRQANADLEVFFQAYPLLFLRLDNEGTILDWKGELATDFDIPPENLPGKRIYDLPFDEADNKFLKAVHHVRETRSMVTIECSIKVQEQKKYYEARLLPSQGNKLIAIIRNITDRKQTEKKIYDLQRYNRGLIETSLDPLVTFDQQGIIMDVNKATIRATGRNHEELTGTPFADYFTDPEKAYKGAMLVFKTGEVRDYELVMKARNGKKTFVSYNASLYRDQAGQVIGAFAAARDITSLKRSEKELRRERDKVKKNIKKIYDLQRYNRGLIETSLDPLVTFDQQGIIMDVNEATIRATGRNHEELTGTPFADYFTDPEKAYKGAMLVFETGEVRDYELVMKARNGKKTFVSYNASLYRDQAGQVIGAFAAARDITSLKRSEKELRRERDKVKKSIRKKISLLNERAELIAQLEKANIQLRELDRMKSAFLANMSHELRTPMNSIIGYTDLLADRIDGPINEEQEKSLKKIAANSKHLLQLINSILNISKIESDKLVLNPGELNLKRLVESVISIFDPQTKKKGLTITDHIDPDLPLLYGDEEALKQILINLLSNAVKFTAKGGITISAGLSNQGIKPDEQPISAEVCVEDTGIGIKEEDLNTIFDKFVQVDPSTIRQYEGTGLGLSIAKGLVSAHKGMIWVTSRYGEGSKFYFTIPLYRAA
ncbi:MAG: PAS domain-containing sensor histidine kinase [Thermodesulfobacteriota bacterium]|nr:PAS domain-containing sensor histidine kinase [Thermodesulfobacteriota bacterium]